MMEVSLAQMFLIVEEEEDCSCTVEVDLNQGRKREESRILSGPCLLIGNIFMSSLPRY